MYLVKRRGESVTASLITIQCLGREQFENVGRKVLPDENMGFIKKEDDYW